MAVGPASIARPAPVAGRPITLRGLLEREGVFSWIMLTPGVLFLLAFVAYPFFYGIFLSLEEHPVARAGRFVGFANFVILAHDGVFWQVTVLKPDGSVPNATPPDPAGLRFQVDPGVSAMDIALDFES